MNKLFVRPFAWSSVNPSAAAIKENPLLIPSIQIFGYTRDYRTIYVRVPRKSTFILKFAEDIDDDMISNISEILSPTTILVSELDDKILIVRAPELSPIELTANPDNEDVATWIDAKQDPHGELESLWEARNIGPYEWISINGFTPLPGKYTSCDLNIITDDTNIEPSDQSFHDINLRLLFWDIETNASKPGEFPQSSNPDDFIFMISLITVNKEGTNSYVIVKGNVNIDEINTGDSSVVITKAKDEKDLISQFFAIHSTFKPDREIYYNGDMFDMPYLLDRLTLHNYEVPKISKILPLIPPVTTHRYPTPFGSEIARTIKLPGTEIIDLLHYYRRFYPHFKNHRLDTVARNFLGRGKTDLSIDEMMNAIRTNDPNKIARVVDYSYVDSLRMYELWNITNVQSHIETICNNLGISTDSLLRSSPSHIIDLTVYNIDPGSVLVDGETSKPMHLREATNGIYRNVFIYDYSELYRQVMLTSTQRIAVVLANRLEESPPLLIVSAFYSKYVDRDELLPQLNTLLDKIINTNTVIALEPSIIRSIGSLEADWLKIIDTSPCYVSVTKASYITLNNNGEMETAGLGRLCRPKFELASEVIQNYLSSIYSGNLKDFVIPELDTVPLNKLTLSEKIGNIMQLERDTLKYELAAQYGSIISTWVSVKYLMVLRKSDEQDISTVNNDKSGLKNRFDSKPVLLSLITPEDVVDYNYYIGELGKYIADLQTLKLYGI